MVSEFLDTTNNPGWKKLNIAAGVGYIGIHRESQHECTVVTGRDNGPQKDATPSRITVLLHQHHSARELTSYENTKKTN